MYQSSKNAGSFASLNLKEEDKELLSRINAYSEQVLGDIDPQKTRISFQLEQLKPVMQEIAEEKNLSLEEVFIRYMDLASMVSAKQDAMLREDLEENGLSDFSI